MHHCFGATQVERERDELSSVYAFDLFLTIYLNFHFMNEFQHTMASYYLLLYNICGKITTQEKEVYRGIVQWYYLWLYSVNKVTKYLNFAA